ACRRVQMHQKQFGRNLALLSVFTFCTSMTQTGNAQDSVPIMGWHSIPASEVSLERFKEMAGAGFTHSFMGYDAETNLRALDFAQQAGMKLIIQDARFFEDEDTLEKAVRGYKNHPALEAYGLRDEPGAAAFEQLATVRNRLKKADPNHWSYVNLYPNYADAEQLQTPTYTEHVRRFQLTFRPEILSYDHYCILDDGTYRPQYYENLEIIRSSALEFNVPFWAFTLSVPFKPYPMPTDGHLRFQVWSIFAYGAKGLQYFTYWTPKPGTWDFHDAPIGLDGTRSPTYDLAKVLNADVQVYATLFMNSSVTAVYHTEPLPNGTKGLDESAPFTAVEGGEALIAVHVLPDKRRYAIVVNRSFTNPVHLTLTKNRNLKSIGRATLPTGAVHTLDVCAENPTFSLSLSAGDAALLELDWKER
ncbi:MAG: hypothetical protein ABIH23_15435, partial [bacterium]